MQEPLSAETMLGIIWLIVVIGAVGIVGGLRLLEWAWGQIDRWRAYVAQRKRPGNTEWQPEPVDAPVAGNDNESLPPIAITKNDDNALLPGNTVLRARAEVLARIIQSGQLHMPDGKGGYKRITQTALIRLATGLEPSGRPESDYGLLIAELKPLLERPIVARDNDGIRVIQRQAV
jgi:hypothetical protein